LRFSRRSFVSGTLAAGVTLRPAARSHAAPASAAAPRTLRIQKVGYDGTMPGPTLQIRRGEELWIRAVNETAEPTAIHWHGVRLANAMDGAPPLTQAPITPGQSFDYRFTVPDAGTFWYRSAAAASALYGAFIVEEVGPVDVDHDVTLMVAGPRANGDPTFTINGANDFEIRARANERLRLRLLNVSATQILGLRVAELRTFVMATDGQPAQPFAARDGRLLLGPGNRIDVFVDCTLTPGSSAPIMIESAGGSTSAATIVCEAGALGRAAQREDPKPLPPNPLPERMDLQNSLRVDTTIGRNGAKPDIPLFGIKRGRTVTLGISNPTLANGFIHLHGHSFRLLDALDDGWKPFWLDTMPIEPHGKTRIAFVADNPGKWLIEGLGSTDTWFEVN
jgi:FtsP/CotA-like multicopper oxidase with cupredoxin domain